MSQPASAPSALTGIARYWAGLSTLAMAFSLGHVIVDWQIGLNGPGGIHLNIAQTLLLWTEVAIYGLWTWSLGNARSGDRAAAATVLVLNFGWALINNGVPIASCPPACVTAFPTHDLAHLGSVLFGGLSSFAAWNLVRTGRGRVLWVLPVAATVLMLLGFTLQGTLAGAPAA